MCIRDRSWGEEKKIGTAVGTIAAANRGEDVIATGPTEATGGIEKTTSAMAVAVAAAVVGTGIEGGTGIEIAVESVGGTGVIAASGGWQGTGIEKRETEAAKER